MKLLKLIGLLFTFTPMAMALNFSGVQTMVGLNRTVLFTAPASGIYFVNGQLTLPSLSSTGGQGASGVVAVVSKNNVTALYTGVAGATGFSIPYVTLVSNDLITVGLSSVAPIDQVSPNGFNVIKGQVYFGNAF